MPDFRHCSSARTTVHSFAVRSGEAIREHSHDSIHVYLQQSGSAAEYLGQKTRVLGPGSVRVSPPGTVHAIDYSSISDITVIHLDRDAVDATTLSLIPNSSRFSNIQHLESLLRQAREIPVDEFSVLEWEELACRLIAPGHSDPVGATPDWLLSVRTELIDRASQNVDVAIIARDQGVHRTTLARQFRRYMGCSIGEFVRRRRLTSAIDLMQESKMSLGRIAVESGFSDHAHFCRMFQRYLGIKPSAFRARASYVQD